MSREREIIRDLEWFSELLKNVLVECGERQWEDIKIRDYYEDAIVAILQEIKTDIANQNDKAKEETF